MMDKILEPNLCVLEESGILRITMRGVINDASAREITKEAIRVAPEHDIERFLYDLSAAQLNMTAVELYALPREFPDSATHRVAALITKNDPKRDDWQFLEDVERNIGIQMKLCTSEEEALVWLTST